jgi:hypothetical protein
VTTAVEIPLISAPQKFEITLAGVAYNMTVRWCAPGQFWGLDIRDQDNVDILLGVPLITGGDLLDGYEYLDIGGQLWVVTDYDAGAPPTSSNLGTQSHLYFVTP